MLARQGLIEEALAGRIVTALGAVEIEPDAADEDVHSAIERLLGDLGPAVHAGRSRNDQVQTAMRLWVMQASRSTPPRRCASWGRCSSPAPAATATPSCPGTPTASAPSRCGWDSTWPRTAGRSAATCGGCRQVRSARRLLPAGRGGAGRFEPAARSRLGGAGAGLLEPVREPAGRRLRPRLRVGAGVRRGAVHGAPVAAGRGAGAVDVGRVRLRRARRLGRDRLVDDAAEEESRRGRADARQGGHRGRPAGGPAGDAQGAAARLQPRPAGGQAGGVRRRSTTCWARSGRSPCACAGCASTPSGWRRRPAMG